MKTLGEIPHTRCRSVGSKGLVTKYMEGGGLQNGRGASEVLPLRKGGGSEKVLAMLLGGTTSFEVVFME